MDSSSTRAISRIAAILFLLGLAVSPALHAGPLNSTIISMFPKDVSELGYADLGKARQFPWFPQLEAQLVPVSIFGFEQFLDGAQLQQAPSVAQVAWARVSLSPREPGKNAGHPAAGDSQLVAIAAGEFDIETIKFVLDQHGVPSVQAGSEVLYSAQTGLGMSEGYFDLIDNQTIAFGPLEALKRIVGIREGHEGNLSANVEMMAMINQVNGDAVFWGVLDSAEVGPAVQHLVPEVMKFPQANDLVKKLKDLLISVKAADSIELDFQADSATPADAVVLSQLLEASMLYKRYQSSRENPAMAKILDGMLITPNGNKLVLSLTMSDDQMTSLIEHNTFTLAK